MYYVIGRAKALRACTIFMICLSMSLPARASDVVNGLSASKFHSPVSGIEKMPGFGAIDDMFIGASDKQVIFIKDAHANLNAQLSIAALINALTAAFGINKVFEEGYEGPVPTAQYFSALDDDQIREKVAYFLLDHLRIGGAEYAHITQNQSFDLIGTEKLSLYLKNIRLYREGSPLQNEIMTDLKEIQAELESSAYLRFTPEVKQLYKLKKMLRESKLTFDDYILRVSRINSDFYQRHVLKDSNLDKILKVKMCVSSCVFENFEFDHEALQRELYQYENAIVSFFAENRKQTRLWSWLQGLALLRRLSGFEAGYTEFKQAKEFMADFNSADLAEYLAEENKRVSVLSKKWINKIERAFDFYETAIERENSLGEDFEDFLVSENENKAILVFGGFHEEGIKRFLENQGISYLIISPKIERFLDRHESFYKEIMSDAQNTNALHSAISEGTRPPSIFAMERAGIYNPSDLRDKIARLGRYAASIPDQPVNILDLNQFEKIWSRSGISKNLGQKSEMRTDAVLDRIEISVKKVLAEVVAQQRHLNFREDQENSVYSFALRKGFRESSELENYTTLLSDLERGLEDRLRPEEVVPLSPLDWYEYFIEVLHRVQVFHLYPLETEARASVAQLRGQFLEILREAQNDEAVKTKTAEQRRYKKTMQVIERIKQWINLTKVAPHINKLKTKNMITLLDVLIRDEFESRKINDAARAALEQLRDLIQMHHDGFRAPALRSGQRRLTILKILAKFEQQAESVEGQLLLNRSELRNDFIMIDRSLAASILTAPNMETKAIALQRFFKFSLGARNLVSQMTDEMLYLNRDNFYFIEHEGRQVLTFNLSRGFLIYNGEVYRVPVPADPDTKIKQSDFFDLSVTDQFGQDTGLTVGGILEAEGLEAVVNKRVLSDNARSLIYNFDRSYLSVHQFYISAYGAIGLNFDDSGELIHGDVDPTLAAVFAGASAKEKVSFFLNLRTEPEADNSLVLSDLNNMVRTGAPQMTILPGGKADMWMPSEIKAITDIVSAAARPMTSTMIKAARPFLRHVRLVLNTRHEFRSAELERAYQLISDFQTAGISIKLKWPGDWPDFYRIRFEISETEPMSKELSDTIRTLAAKYFKSGVEVDGLAEGYFEANDYAVANILTDLTALGVTQDYLLPGVKKRSEQRIEQESGGDGELEKALKPLLRIITKHAAYMDSPKNKWALSPTPDQNLKERVTHLTGYHSVLMELERSLIDHFRPGGDSATIMEWYLSLQHFKTRLNYIKDLEVSVVREMIDELLSEMEETQRRLDTTDDGGMMRIRLQNEETLRPVLNELNSWIRANYMRRKWPVYQLQPLIKQLQTYSYEALGNEFYSHLTQVERLLEKLERFQALLRTPGHRAPDVRSAANDINQEVINLRLNFIYRSENRTVDSGLLLDSKISETSFMRSEQRSDPVSFQYNIAFAIDGRRSVLSVGKEQYVFELQANELHSVASNTESKIEIADHSEYLLQLHNLIKAAMDASGFKGFFALTLNYEDEGVRIEVDTSGSKAGAIFKYQNGVIETFWYGDLSWVEDILFEQNGIFDLIVLPGVLNPAIRGEALDLYNALLEGHYDQLKPFVRRHFRSEQRSDDEINQFKRLIDAIKVVQTNQSLEYYEGLLLDHPGISLDQRDPLLVTVGDILYFRSEEDGLKPTPALWRLISSDGSRMVFKAVNRVINKNAVVLSPDQFKNGIERGGVHLLSATEPDEAMALRSTDVIDESLWLLPQRPNIVFFTSPREENSDPYTVSSNWARRTYEEYGREVNIILADANAENIRINNNRVYVRNASVIQQVGEKIVALHIDEPLEAHYLYASPLSALPADYVQALDYSDIPKLLNRSMLVLQGTKKRQLELAEEVNIPHKKLLRTISMPEQGISKREVREMLEAIMAEEAVTKIFVQPNNMANSRNSAGFYLDSENGMREAVTGIHTMLTLLPRTLFLIETFVPGPNWGGNFQGFNAGVRAVVTRNPDESADDPWIVDPIKLALSAETTLDITLFDPKDLSTFEETVRGHANQTVLRLPLDAFLTAESGLNEEQKIQLRERIVKRAKQFAEALIQIKAVTDYIAVDFILSQPDVDGVPEVIFNEAATNVAAEANWDKLAQEGLTERGGFHKKLYERAKNSAWHYFTKTQEVPDEFELAPELQNTIGSFEDERQELRNRDPAKLIWYVDDEEDFLRAAESIYSRPAMREKVAATGGVTEDFEIRVFQSPSDLLNALREDAVLPDLIISDFNMKHALNGIDLTQKIRNELGISSERLAIVIATLQDKESSVWRQFEALRERAILDGAVGGKPNFPAQFIDALTQAGFVRDEDMRAERHELRSLEKDLKRVADSKQTPLLEKHVSKILKAVANGKVKLRGERIMIISVDNEERETDIGPLDRAVADLWFEPNGKFTKYRTWTRGAKQLLRRTAFAFIAMGENARSIAVISSNEKKHNRRRMKPIGGVAVHDTLDSADEKSIYEQTIRREIIEELELERFLGQGYQLQGRLQLIGNEGGFTVRKKNYKRRSATYLYHPTQEEKDAIILFKAELSLAVRDNVHFDREVSDIEFIPLNLLYEAEEFDDESFGKVFRGLLTNAEVIEALKLLDMEYETLNSANIDSIIREYAEIVSSAEVSERAAAMREAGIDDSLILALETAHAMHDQADMNNVTRVKAVRVLLKRVLDAVWLYERSARSLILEDVYSGTFKPYLNARHEFRQKNAALYVSELRRVWENRSIEDSAEAVAVLFDGQELAKTVNEADKRIYEELSILLRRHPDFKLFFYNITEIELRSIESKYFQEMLRSFPNSIKVLHDESRLRDKIVIRAALTQAGRSSHPVVLANGEYLAGVPIHKLYYDRAGALEGFLRLLESVTKAELLQHAYFGIAERGRDDYWQVEVSLTDVISQQLTASYAVAWSA